MRRVIAVITAMLWMGVATAAQEHPQPFLYKASLVQAAPGKLVELIDLYKQQFAQQAKGPAGAPLWMRHSQGDRWDLLILTPIGSYAEYVGATNAASSAEARPDTSARANGDSLAAPQSRIPALPEQSGWEQRRKADVAWEEDVFVFGPALAELRKGFDGAGFFHVDMFRVLPGRLKELIREREMENAYARAIKQPDNFIFVRDQGAAWDVFTIGCFRDLKHYALSADVPRETAEAAAKQAGFESAAAIGPYLRQFIADHHDTLAVAVR